MRIDNLEMVIEALPYRHPEQKMIVSLIFRAFKDALGPSLSSCSNSRTRQALAKEDGIAFINGDSEIFFGNEWYDAAELCTLATGSDYLVRGLKKALNGNFTINSDKRYIAIKEIEI